MPPRTLRSSIQPDPKELANQMREITGGADDPIGYVSIKWGAYNAGTRVLTLQVTDRLKKDYAPRQYLGYNSRKGTGDGRWLVRWYVAADNFGTPISAGSAYTAGKQLSDLSGYITSETDENGKISLTITKGGDMTWAHAGIGQLMRSRGIDWVNAPSDDAPGGSGADPVTGGGGGGGGTPTGGPATSGPGSGDIILDQSGSIIVFATE